MAKGVSDVDYNALAAAERRRVDREIQKLYRKAVDDAARIGTTLPPLDAKKPLNFKRHASANKSINRIIKRLNEGISAAITRSCERSWAIGDRKNDTLLKVLLDGALRGAEQYYEARLAERNNAARDAFIKRVQEGFVGSSRVWNNEMFKSELELAMDLALEKGQSATSLARELRQYLNNPDALFRRVRDKHGNLVLSQAAKAYHPGQGVYRSAYKNALRYAGTSTNMAYRTADHERIQNARHVVGIEIHLSNNHTTKNSKGEEVPLYDICDILAGKYPKDYLWTGWHPNCRCFMTTVLKTDEELREDRRRVLRGEEPLPPEASKNYVGDTPQAFKDWIVDNDERLARSSSLPYFVRDNAKYVSEAVYGTYNNAAEDMKAKIHLIQQPRKTMARVAFEPFSPIIVEKMSAVRDKKNKLRLFDEIINDGRAKTIITEGDFRTVLFGQNKGPNTPVWEQTLRMAKALNSSGSNVAFLPEYEEDISADALILFKGLPTTADFKYSSSTNPNTISKELTKGFRQADIIVLKLDKMDRGQFRESIEYLVRNNSPLGNIILINSKDMVKEITKTELARGVYDRKIKGFL